MDVKSNLISMDQGALLSKTNLIINYLPQTLTDEEFRSMFLAIGPVKASKIVRDKMTGYSYGFGFVDYNLESDASKAIQTLNGLQLQNKRIKVAYSRSGEQIKGANLYVRNIPRTMTQNELEEIFSPHGEIIQSRILTDVGSGQSKGVGFILFNTRDQAENAISHLDGFVPEGGELPFNVKHAEDNRGKARPPVIVVNQRQSGGGPPPPPPSQLFGNGTAEGYGAGPGGYGPMRSQNRFNRFNPMTSNYNSNSAPIGDSGFVLFVYNIGPDADERELWQLFSPFGVVQKVNVIRDTAKNTGKGFGFVSMANYQEAMSAIHNLNGYKYYQNKPLQVSFKTPKA
nr:RNA-binding protein Elav2 [Capitella teleta]